MCLKTILTFYTLSPQGSKVVIQIPTFSMITSNSPLNNVITTEQITFTGGRSEAAVDNVQRRDLSKTIPCIHRPSWIPSLSDQSHGTGDEENDSDHDH